MPGPHGFTVREPAHPSRVPAASTASRPDVRDVRETPLCVGRDAKNMEVIWVKREAESFFAEDWTGQITLIAFEKSVFRRKAFLTTIVVTEADGCTDLTRRPNQ